MFTLTPFSMPRLLQAGILLLVSPALFAQAGFGLDTGNRLPVVRSSVLPAEEAFALSTFIEAPDTVVLMWEIKEGYYLYRKSISATDSSGSAVNIGELAEGEIITDEFFGEVAVYFDRIFHRFPLFNLAMNDNTATFTLQYQGCAKDLYCYPMQSQEVTLSLPE